MLSHAQYLEANFEKQKKKNVMRITYDKKPKKIK